MAHEHMETGEEITGTPDIRYDIVSVLYHALEAADTCKVYLEDAEDSGDEHLVAFFRDVVERNHEIADRARQLLFEKMRSSSDPACH